MCSRLWFHNRSCSHSCLIRALHCLHFRPSIEIQFAQDDRSVFPFADSQRPTATSPDEENVFVLETDAEREHDVQQIVRELIKGVIITERDTLRRSVRKKRDRLSKVFTIEPTAAADNTSSETI